MLHKKNGLSTARYFFRVPRPAFRSRHLQNLIRRKSGEGGTVASTTASSLRIGNDEGHLTVKDPLKESRLQQNR